MSHIEIEKAIEHGDECGICERDAEIYIPQIELALCKKCARKLCMVIKQEIS